MSNRKPEQISELAALKVAHEQQIAALTDEGLSDEQRVRRFEVAAECPDGWIEAGLKNARVRSIRSISPARLAWQTPFCTKSLFGNLPGCYCPVNENRFNDASYHGIPDRIPLNWHPSRETLEAFARVQQDARFPND